MAVAEIERGRRFEVGATSDEVLEGYEVCFAAVTPTQREELLTCALGQPQAAIRRFAADTPGRRRAVAMECRLRLYPATPARRICVVEDLRSSAGPL